MVKKENGILLTIDSDDEVPDEISVLSEDSKFVTKTRKKLKPQSSTKAEFHFEFDDGKMDVEDVVSEDDDSDASQSISDNDNVKEMPHAAERMARAEKKSKSREVPEDSAVDTGMDAEMEAEYFDSVVDTSADGASSIQFTQLNLSRPFLRAVEAMGFVAPTPIQAQVIPIAMAGRDVCASAETGSGKTAAFALPVLERLLYRSKDQAAIRILVITPTRELATQIHEVVTKLTMFTKDITCALILGGKKDIKSQEALLRQRPDIVICTPGRMLDHLRNSPSIHFDDVDVLILDEVDRLLDLGFQEEVEQLVKYCPVSRQTMLFSATMTPKVEDLAKLSLKRPVRVKTNSSTTAFAPRLVQEFIKVRDPDEVEAILCSLVCRSFGDRTIVFFEMKKNAHHFSILLQCLDIKVSELHGNLTQPQREQALKKFREGQTDVLVCTDIAARGIDITGIQTVINAEMPRNASTYVHRVGRTARAGKQGRAITLVTDNRRKIMKDILKGEGAALSSGDGGQVLSRNIPASVIAQYAQKLEDIEDRVHEFILEEKARAKIDRLQEGASRAENMLMHADEIAARPARTWYQTETQKEELRKRTTELAKEEGEVARVGRAAVMEQKSKERAAALRDEYRMDDTGKSDKHRLSRKKRRRMEALESSRQDSEAAAGEGDDGSADDDAPAPKKLKKPAAPAKKETKLDRAAGEFNMKRVSVTKEGRSTKASKVVRQKFAVGGLEKDVLEFGEKSGLGGISKKQLKLAAMKEQFSEFDPSKRLRKGGKIGKSSFKSKGKYKRRK